MKRVTLATLLNLLLLPGAFAAEVTHALDGGKLLFSVPETWLGIGETLEGPRQFSGFMIPWADGAKTPGSVSILSFCEGSPAEVKKYIATLQGEARAQPGFKAEGEGPALERYDSMRYGATQGGEAFAIGDYYLPRGDCGVQLRFAVPASEAASFAPARDGVLKSLQTK